MDTPTPGLTHGLRMYRGLVREGVVPPVKGFGASQPGIFLKHLYVHVDVNKK